MAVIYATLIIKGIVILQCQRLLLRLEPWILILFMTWGTGIDQEMRLILPLSPECYQVRSIKECMLLIRDIMILTQKRLY